VKIFPVLYRQAKRSGYNDGVISSLQVTTMPATQALFPDDAIPPLDVNAPEAEKAALPKALARVLMPNRTQLEWRASDLESLLPPGHRARLVWGYIERQDLEGLYAGINAAARARRWTIC